MNLTYFLTMALISWSFATSVPPKELGSIEDFDHPFKGCPENSDCDEQMAKQLSLWKELLKSIKERQLYGAKKSQPLEEFRKKHGIPVEFYTKEKSLESFRPALLSSSCRHHQQDQSKKILRGIAFIKSIHQDRAVVWQNGKEIEISYGDLFMPQSLTFFHENKEYHYKIPLEDEPIFFKGEDLYFLREDQDVYFAYKISRNGDWQIVDTDMGQLSSLQEKKTIRPCPKSETQPKSEIFQTELCKALWNEESTQSALIRIQRGCST